MALKNVKLGTVTLTYRDDSLDFMVTMDKLEAIRKEFKINPYLAIVNLADDSMMGSRILESLQVGSDDDRNLIGHWLWGDLEATTTEEWREMMVAFIAELMGSDKEKVLHDYHEQKKEAEEALKVKTEAETNQNS